MQGLVRDSKFSPRVHNLTMVGKMGERDKMVLDGIMKDSPTMPRRQVIKSLRLILARLPEIEDS